jgi:hypothetical protein
MRTSLDPTHSSVATYDIPGPNDVKAALPKLTDRDEREVAEARVAAYLFEGGHTEFGPCDYPLHPTLFRKQPGDVSLIDQADVRQDRLGDCFLLAPLAALTRTAEGRALIQNMVSENRDENGALVSYTVTLHTPRWPHVETKVTVAPTFECGHAKTRRDGDSAEVWPMVIEAAYAKLVGGYAEIQGGFTGVAMTILTGRSAEWIGLSGLSRGYNAERLKRDLAAGKMVVFDTRDDLEPATCQLPPDLQDKPHLQGAYNLYPGHAYVAIGTEERDGKQYVRLHNPWNKDEPDAVPFDELPNWFAGINVGSVNR